jgi:hypothetical protein
MKKLNETKDLSSPHRRIRKVWIREDDEIIGARRSLVGWLVAFAFVLAVFIGVILTEI